VTSLGEAWSDFRMINIHNASKYVSFARIVEVKVEKKLFIEYGDTL
jgi:hypothetical protein